MIQQKPNVNPYEYYSASASCSKLGIAGIKELQELASKHKERIVCTARKAGNGVDVIDYLGASLITLWILEIEEVATANAERQNKALKRLQKCNPKAYIKARRINDNCPAFRSLSPQRRLTLQIKELHKLHSKKQVKLRLTDEEIQRKNEARR